jgi:hypothetical protein
MMGHRQEDLLSIISARAARRPRRWSVGDSAAADSGLAVATRFRRHTPHPSSVADAEMRARRSDLLDAPSSGRTGGCAVGYGSMHGGSALRPSLMLHGRPQPGDCFDFAKQHVSAMLSLLVRCHGTGTLNAHAQLRPHQLR